MRSPPWKSGNDADRTKAQGILWRKRHARGAADLEAWNIEKFPMFVKAPFF